MTTGIAQGSDGNEAWKGVGTVFGDWGERQPMVDTSAFVQLLQECGVDDESAKALTDQHSSGKESIDIRDFYKWLDYKEIVAPSPEVVGKPTSAELLTFESLVNKIKVLTSKYPDNQQLRHIMKDAGWEPIKELDEEGGYLSMAASVLKAASMFDTGSRIYTKQANELEKVVELVKSTYPDAQHRWYYLAHEKKLSELKGKITEANEHEAAALNRFAELQMRLQKNLAPGIIGDLCRYDDAFEELDLNDLKELLRVLKPFTKRNAAVAKLGGLKQEGNANLPSWACIEQLHKEATLNNADSHRLAQRVAERSNGKYVSGPLKKVDRMIEKTEEDNGGDYWKLCDIDRHSVTYEDLTDLMEGVKALIQFDEDDLCEVIRVKVRLDPSFNARRDSGGYRDVLINFRQPGAPYRSHISEMQLHLKSFLKIKSGGGHKTYKVIRSLQLFDEAMTCHWGKLDANVLDKVKFGAVVELRLDFMKDLDFEELAAAFTHADARVEILSLKGVKKTDEQLAAVLKPVCAAGVLRSLDVSGLADDPETKITSLPWAEMKGLKKLTHLLFSDNEVSALPDDVFELRSLKVLEFAQNPINSEFPQKIVQLTRLTQLRARQCGFTGSVPQNMAFACKHMAWFAINVNDQLDPESIANFAANLKYLTYADFAKSNTESIVNEEQRARIERDACENCKIAWTRGTAFMKFKSGWLKVDHRGRPV